MHNPASGKSSQDPHVINGGQALPDTAKGDVRNRASTVPKQALKPIFASPALTDPSANPTFWIVSGPLVAFTQS
jgi:hypothetical protein